MKTRLSSKISLCIAAIMLCAGISIFANDEKAKTIKKNGKEFTEYTVAEGESLYAVSKNTGVTQEDIIKFNSKAIDGVKKGQKLLIPVKPTVINNDTQDSITFITHVVAPKETMYSISKKYGITQATLAQYNPELETGLKADQTLRIPKFKDKKAATQAAKKATSTIKHPYSEDHVVMPKETLYGISRQYGVSQSDLLEMNPELADGLKIGMTIKIPSKAATANSTMARNDTAKSVTKAAEKAEQKNATTNTNTTSDTNKAAAQTNATTAKTSTPTTAASNAKTKKMTISLLLPLMLDEPDGTVNKFIEFYEGVLMAANELKDKGYNLKINVYDTKKSEYGVQSALKNNPEIASSNYIIGPAYANQVSAAATYGKEKHIPVIIPFTSKAENTANQYVYQFNGREGSLFNDAAEKCIEEFKGKNVIIVNFNNYQEDEGSEFAKYLQTIATRKNGAPYKNTKFNQSTWSSLANQVAKDKENVIMLATEEKDLVKDLLSEIKTWSEKNPSIKISVMGQENWGDELLTAPSTYYYSQFRTLSSKRYTDYNDKFKENFGAATTQSPRFDLIGRDITMSIAGETEGIQSKIKWDGSASSSKTNGGCYLIKVSEGKKTVVR